MKIILPHPPCVARPTEEIRAAIIAVASRAATAAAIQVAIGVAIKAEATAVDSPAATAAVDIAAGLPVAALKVAATAAGNRMAVRTAVEAIHRPGTTTANGLQDV